eukprot:TRINITY_DN22225_c1_g1_i1.p1 TRINITY_DN22225_c1_g1~~TRINITY_DN22225_c1_g1_i1.p1  ORF type:complete len:381 (+),score=53.89 TRINITY_DN22225_c1_g1_i1:148-1290(+)
MATRSPESGTLGASGRSDSLSALLGRSLDVASQSAASRTDLSGIGGRGAEATLGARASEGTLGGIPARRPWDELKQKVLQPDGAVRTPVQRFGPTTKAPSPAAAAAAASPHRPRQAGPSQPRAVRPYNAGLGVSMSTASSRGNSSRGNSSGGASSRSSSRDIGSFDADISSKDSSGYWETSTNSSEPSRPLTPPEVSPSPLGTKGVLHPHPIRILPELLDEEVEDTVEIDEVDVDNKTSGAGADDIEPEVSRPGMPLKSDPYCRDAPRRSEVKAQWTPSALTKYLKKYMAQIASNLKHKKMPTADQLDAFTSRLVANIQKNLESAPTKVRHALQALIGRKFHKFWDFARNEKVRQTTPDELRSALSGAIESLMEFNHTMR